MALRSRGSSSNSSPMISSTRSSPRVLRVCSKRRMISSTASLPTSCECRRAGQQHSKPTATSYECLQAGQLRSYKCVQAGQLSKPTPTRRAFLLRCRALPVLGRYPIRLLSSHPLRIHLVGLCASGLLSEPPCTASSRHTCHVPVDLQTAARTSPFTPLRNMSGSGSPNGPSR